MSAVDSRPGLPASRGCLVVGLAAAVLLAGGAILWPSAVAMGWLVGFAFWSSLPIGAIVLALIHETTGGRWGLAAAPTLRLFCLCALLSPLFFIVLAFSVTLIYPWAREGSSIAPDVARLMLNTRLYAVYGLVALLGWAAIALLLAAGRLGLLGASLSLVFHGIAISVVPVAWLLSVDPRFTDSGFGAEMAVQQILFPLAAIAALSPARAIAIAKGDIAALLLASALGAFYLGLMTFIVKWYGDQPDDAAWYLARAHGLAFALLLGALVFGAAVPILACAWERIRTSARAMRLVGLCTMLGIFLHDLWLVNATLRRRARCARFPRRHGRLVAGPRAVCRSAVRRLVAQSRPSARGGNMTIGRDDGGARRVTRRNSSSARMKRAVPLVILAGLGLWLLARSRAYDHLAATLQMGAERVADLTDPDAGRREPPAIRAGVVAAIMAGFFLFVVLVAIGLFAFYRWRAHDASFVKVETFAAPRLQTLADGLADPEIARQKADLDRSRWLDAGHHVFQIPIEDAMRLVAARGSAAYDPVPRGSDPQQRPTP